jgi:hypothetical protein
VENRVLENKIGVPKVVQVFWFAMKKSRIHSKENIPQKFLHIKNNKKEKDVEMQKVIAIQELDIIIIIFYYYNF